MTLNVSAELTVGRRSWKAPIDRIFNKVLVGDGCWTWIGGKAKGYGQIQIGGRSVYAHRLFYELFNGPCPDDLDVLHECDNPSCVRPAHLKLGTHAQNMADASRRGRTWSPSGDASPRAKLTAEQVAEIRSTRISSTTLGVQFGVHPSRIRQIRRGKGWRDVP